MINTAEYGPFVARRYQIGSDGRRRAMGFGRTMMLVAMASVGATGFVSTPSMGTSASHAEPAAPIVMSFDSRPSHSGRLRGAVVAYPAQLDGGDWIVRLETASGQSVAGAEVSAEAFMPETAAIPNAAARVAEYLGNGEYRIEGLAFPHAGWWNVSLAVTHLGQTDSLAFNLIMPSS